MLGAGSSTFLIALLSVGLVMPSADAARGPKSMTYGLVVVFIGPRAASALGMTRPTESKAIKKVELPAPSILNSRSTTRQHGPS